MGPVLATVDIAGFRVQIASTVSFHPEAVPPANIRLYAGSRGLYAESRGCTRNASLSIYKLSLSGRQTWVTFPGLRGLLPSEAVSPP